MRLFCFCDDWEPQIAKVNGPIELKSMRSGFRWQYDGKPFKFCPWCGQQLIEEEDDSIRGADSADVPHG